MLHVELPVSVIPQRDMLSPKASLKSTTKYIGKNAASPLVAKPELAQSYMHHPRIARLWFGGRFLSLVGIRGVFNIAATRDPKMNSVNRQSVFTLCHFT